MTCLGDLNLSTVSMNSAKDVSQHTPSRHCEYVRTRVLVITTAHFDEVDETPLSNFAHVLKGTVFLCIAVAHVVGRVQLDADNEVVWNNPRCTNREHNIA